MAKKNLAKTVFSNNELAKYAEYSKAIEDAQFQADGLARVIAGSLARIKALKLYEIDDFKNIYEYAEQKHGISRGTVSDAINVFKRFEDPDNKGKLLPGLDAYPWRALIAMKSVPTNDHLERLGIDPTMKSAEIIQRVKDYKEAVNKFDLPTDWDYESLVALIEKPALEDGDSAESSEAPETESTKKSSDKDAHLLEDDTEEKPYDYVSAYINMYGQDAYEELEVAEEGNDIVQACKDIVEEFTTFPKRTFNIKEMDEKELFKLLKPLLEGVQNGEYDIILTA